MFVFLVSGAICLGGALGVVLFRNTVHNALSLVATLFGVAVLFIAQEAYFLAAIQVIVYAGAIMVLFLFVIMLLGAERVLPEAQPRFRWLTPAAVILALVFLATTSVAIIKGEIDLTQPQLDEPMVRVVNALDGVAAVDVYLDETQVADQVAFGEASSFEDWDTGRYQARIFEAGADPESDPPLAEYPVNLVADVALSLTAIGTAQDPDLVTVTEDLGQINDKDELRVLAVNALQGRMAIDVVNDTDAGNRRVLAENVPYGTASEIIEIEKATYAIGVYPTGSSRTRLMGIEDEELDADTSVLWVFTEQRQADSSYRNAVINLETDVRPKFGSPEHVGQLLFSRYVLPFEMVSLLLLAAMIGAIVLTHDRRGPRRRLVRRLANVPASLEQPAPGQTGD